MTEIADPTLANRLADEALPRVDAFELAKQIVRPLEGVNYRDSAVALQTAVMVFLANGQVDLGMPLDLMLDHMTNSIKRDAPKIIERMAAHRRPH